MRKNGKRLSALIMSFAAAAFVFTAVPVQGLAYTETTATVSTDNVKVRSSASTTASQVTSLSNGQSITIVDETTDASGYTWYKVNAGGSEGYVRSDLVSKADGTEATTTTTTTNSTEENAAAASLPATIATAVAGSTATVISDTVNIRSGAGTSFEAVGKASNGDSVTITGQSSDSDGNTWYEVTFGADGKTGFIRNDFLQVTEAPAETTEAVDAAADPAATGEGGEATEAETTEDQSSGSAVASEAGDGHYSLVYSTDDGAEGIWYLYDNVEGYRVKVNELIEAAKSSDAVNNLVKTNNTYKTILIVLGVVIAALVVGLIIMALRLRDSLYYEDEEEEYDQFAKIDTSKKRGRDDAGASKGGRPAPSEGRTVRPVREDNGARPQRQPVRRADDDDVTVRPRRVSPEVQQDRPVRRSPEERTVRPSRDEMVENRRVPRDGGLRQTITPNVQEPAPRRKPKNFAGDQDDFEFEFLDLDDKE